MQQVVFVMTVVDTVNNYPVGPEESKMIGVVRQAHGGFRWLKGLLLVLNRLALNLLALPLESLVLLLTSIVMSGH